MSKITIIGDVHGKTGSYIRLLRNLPDRPSIQVGDMGLGFARVQLDPNQIFPRHRFFRGNHDDPAKCRKHPRYMGDWGYDSETSIFHVAGAWSIDKNWRVEGETWWPDEELSLFDLNKALQDYVDTKPRFMLSHEAPTVATYQMLAALMAPSSHADNPTTVVHDGEYRYYKAKLGCANTRTSQALQGMLDIHAPEEWVFGHYHVDKTFYVPGYKTKFTCVAELSTYELETQ